MSQCVFPQTGIDCSSTYADLNNNYYMFVRIFTATLATANLIFIAHTQRKLLKQNQGFSWERLDQKLIVLVTIMTVLTIVRASIDPLGWSGVMSPHLVYALHFVVCSARALAGYCTIMSFLMICRTVTKDGPKNGRNLVILINVKNALDFIYFIVILVVPDSYGIILALHHTTSTVYFSYAYVMTVRTCRVLVNTIKGFQNSKSLRDPQFDTVILRVTRITFGSTLLMPLTWSYGIASVIFYAFGRFNMTTDPYLSPSELDNTAFRVIYSLFLDFYCLIAVPWAMMTLYILSNVYTQVSLPKVLATSSRSSKDRESTEVLPDIPWLLRN